MPRFNCHDIPDRWFSSTMVGNFFIAILIITFNHFNGNVLSATGELPTIEGRLDPWTGIVIARYQRRPSPDVLCVATLIPYENHISDSNRLITSDGCGNWFDETSRKTFRYEIEIIFADGTVRRLTEYMNVPFTKLTLIEIDLPIKFNDFVQAIHVPEKVEKEAFKGLTVELINEHGKLKYRQKLAQMSKAKQCEAYWSIDRFRPEDMICTGGDSTTAIATGAPYYSQTSLGYTLWGVHLWTSYHGDLGHVDVKGHAYYRVDRVHGVDLQRIKIEGEGKKLKEKEVEKEQKNEEEQETKKEQGEEEKGKGKRKGKGKGKNKGKKAA